MKTGKVFAKLANDVRCSTIMFNSGEGDTVVSATVTLTAGWLSGGDFRATVETAHEARLFIEAAVDADGNKGRKRGKRPAQAVTEAVEETQAVDAPAAEFALPKGFYGSLENAPGTVVNTTSKKVTVALWPSEQAALIQAASALIGDENANFGLKGSARATIAALNA